MAAPDPVDTPPPTGGPPDLDRRVTRLETRFEPVDKTLDAIQAEQRDIRGILMDMQGRLARLPTTSAAWGMIATVLAVGIALAGLTFTVANWAASAA